MLAIHIIIPRFLKEILVNWGLYFKINQNIVPLNFLIIFVISAPEIICGGRWRKVLVCDSDEGGGRGEAQGRKY